MSYENAPATKMLATRCAVCARPLLDAVSVERGIGPDCYAKYGSGMDEADPAARDEANKLVYQIALEQNGAGAAKACERLLQLGFRGLAEKILNRVAKVRITVDGAHVFVSGPYIPEAVEILKRASPNRWFDAERCANRFPLDERKEVWDAVQKAYAGLVAVTPTGVRVLGAG